jgi:hypothetical protein
VVEWHSVLLLGKGRCVTGGRVWADRRARLDDEVAGQRSAERCRDGRYGRGAMGQAEQWATDEMAGRTCEGVSARGRKQFPARLEAAD